MMRLLVGVLALLLAAALSPSLLAQVSIETPTLLLSFGDQGRLLQATACYPRCESDYSRQVQWQAEEGVIAFGSGEDEKKWVQRRGLDGDIHELHFTGPAGEVIHWKVPRQGYLVEVRVTGAAALAIRAGPDFRPRPAAGFGGWLEQVRYLVVTDRDTEQIALDSDEAGPVTGEWVGFRSRYWTLLASGDDPILFDLQTGFGNTDAALRSTPIAPSEQAGEAAANAAPAARQGAPAAGKNYAFYLGPIEPTVLAAVDQILPDIMFAGLWFWLRWISFALYFLLGWIQSIVPAWGLAIMVLSAVVHVLMLPLSRAADRVQQQVNDTEARLAPELARIKQAFRGEEQAAKIIALYKIEKVHPLYSLKSLLGVAVVIPIFIGAFDMLAENIHLLNTQFLWIDDLSRPDALFLMPFELPFFGQAFNLLPFLMTGLSLVASVLHRPLALDAASRSRQVRNMFLLALAFFVLFYTFPAGMVLYWATNNLIAVGKSGWARVSPLRA